MRRLYRFLFSRYAVSLLMIILEIGLLLFLFLKAAELSYIFSIVATAVNLMIVVAIVNSETNPEYKISWITVTIFLPFFGGLLFLIFSKRRMTNREITLGYEIYKKMKVWEEDETAFSELGRVDSRGAGQALSIMSGDVLAKVYKNTEARYFSDGQDMYESLLTDIMGAREYVFLEYFIIEDGVMCRSIFEALEKKARCGVEVRVLYDDIGCMGRLTDSDVKKLRAAGIKCMAFARINPSLSTVHNNRDHRKICVIDGAVAYTGGMNIADEYINKRSRFGYWKDGGVRLFGDAAHGFVKLCLQIWSFNSGVCEDFSKCFKKPAHSAIGDGYFLPFGSGPAPIYPFPVGKRAFLNMINQAERYLYVTTPYLIIDFDLSEALRGAAIRGVDVRIITPSIPDKKMVKVMTKSAYPYLIDAGVRIYEYTPGFIHGKLMVCDDLYTIIGSINLDYRSLAHHFESAVWIYSPTLAEEARDDFMITVSMSAAMNERAARLTPLEWIAKILIRFIAPLL